MFLRPPAPRRAELANAHNTQVTLADTPPMRTSATTIASDVRSGARTATSVLEQHLAEIELADGTLEAWVHIDEEGALGARRRLDAGERELALAGVPVGVKDIIDVSGLLTRS
ncbi:MAG: hypothetical protein GY811_28945, partial [Myxococcales bacterium]|nr:hypothetical protein [Myxococcales bacterium]